MRGYQIREWLVANDLIGLAWGIIIVLGIAYVFYQIRALIKKNNKNNK